MIALETLGVLIAGLTFVSLFGAYLCETIIRK